MEIKSKLNKLTLLDFYKLFLSLPFSKASWHFGLHSEFHPKPEALFLQVIPGCASESGPAAVFFLAVLILLLLDSFYSRRIPKFLSFLACIHSELKMSIVPLLKLLSPSFLLSAWSWPRKLISRK